MAIEIDSFLGFSASVPEGSFVVPESSAGAGSEQISLPGDILFSMVRDDDTVRDYAQTVEWTQKLASFYTDHFNGETRTEGRLDGEGKESYAVAVEFSDEIGVLRIAALVGIRFDAGAFFGLTLVWPVTDPEQEPDVALIKRVVDGVTFSPSAAGGN